MIPTKNEESNIGFLLKELLEQLSQDSKIIIADASSTDNTLNIIESFKDNRIIITKGGLPAEGRNSGFKLSSSEYVLFLDADIKIKKNTIKNLLKFLDKHKPDLSTTYIVCDSKNIFSKIIYLLSNLFVILSKLDKPFVIGGFFVIKSDVFMDLGGFDEEVMHCEDYLLSRLIKPSKFKILPGYVTTKDRRIKKMGYLGIIFYFIKNIIKRNHTEYFKNDVNYWK
jgi:glycosyltransferase involved in cell wall biosynthesis